MSYELSNVAAEFYIKFNARATTFEKNLNDFSIMKKVNMPKGFRLTAKPAMPAWFIDGILREMINIRFKEVPEEDRQNPNEKRREIEKILKNKIFDKSLGLVYQCSKLFIHLDRSVGDELIP